MKFEGVTACSSRECAAIHELLKRQRRLPFPPPFIAIPLNGIYFIFELEQRSHGGCDRIVRVGSHTGPNNLARRLWEHITPYGRSRFRRDLGIAVLSHPQRLSFEPIPMDLWDQSALTRRQRATSAGQIGALDRFEIKLSDYIARNFRFSVIGTRDTTEALELEKACIATVSQCDRCRNEARPQLRPNNGFLWNSQHTGQKSPPISDRQLASLAQLVARQSRAD